MAHAHTRSAAGRCYAPSTLDAAQQRYLEGEIYCTRHAQLVGVLEKCMSAQDEPQQQAAVNPLGAVEPVESLLPPMLASSSPPVDPTELEWWPGASAGEVTIEAVDSRGWTASAENELLRVQGWQVECVDDFEKHKLNNYTGNVSRKKAFLKREGLSCYGRCVRGAPIRFGR